MEMDDETLLRYGRQIMLPDVGIEGQQRLLASHVLIIGLGGLGSPIAMYLAAAGIGRFTLIDDDTVELTNLQRQIAHTSADLNTAKVCSARNTMLQLNPDVQVDVIEQCADTELLEQVVPQVDLVIDATDNFAVRFAINAACVKHSRPMVMGAAIRMEGQVSVFQPQLNDSPCYRCLYTEGDEPQQTCADTGVLSPLVGIIGSIQAAESIKVLLGLPDTLTGRLLVVDARTMEFRTLKLKKDPACPVCGH